MKAFLIILVTFSIDRISKNYIINLQEMGSTVDFYILPFLNFYLVWNTGIGFGLVSLEANLYYHILTTLIIIVIFVLFYLLLKAKDISMYLISLTIGGSLGNLFDRLYYYAVPDFIDLHIGAYHWFIFNIADIFITVGITGLIIIEFLKKEKTPKNV